MPRRSWKQVRPTSLRSAIELSLEHARERRRLSVDRVADLMGLSSKWCLYKWLENGRMPALLIAPFEAACGIHLVTGYLASTAHKLCIDIPTGRKSQARDINALQGSLTEAVGALLRFADDKANAETTLSVLTHALEDLAWHKINVQKASAPEFDFEVASND